MFCTNCGKESGAGKFCSYCGAALQQSSSVQQPSQPIMQNAPHPAQTWAQPSLRPRRHTPMRIPLLS